VQLIHAPGRGIRRDHLGMVKAEICAVSLGIRLVVSRGLLLMMGVLGSMELSVRVSGDGLCALILLPVTRILFSRAGSIGIRLVSGGVRISRIHFGVRC